MAQNKYQGGVLWMIIRKISCSVISRVYFSGTTLMVDICFGSACQSVLSVLSPAYRLTLTRSISILHPNKYVLPILQMSTEKETLTQLGSYM